MKFSNYRLRLGRIRLLSTFAQISDHQTMYFALAKPCNYLKSLSAHFQDWESLWLLYSSVLCQPGYILYNRYESSFLPFMRENRAQWCIISHASFVFVHCIQHGQRQRHFRKFQMSWCQMSEVVSRGRAAEVFLTLLGLYLQYSLLRETWHFSGALRDQKMQWTVLMGSKMKNENRKSWVSFPWVLWIPK